MTNYVFSATDGINGTELWTSDGTEAGTSFVKDINTGLADSNPKNFTDLGNGQAVFVATDAVHGRNYG
jgi:ELWxxDGT repeat protein